MPKRQDLEKSLRKRRAQFAKRGKQSSTNDSPRFVTYHHPENLFRIDYPAHWQIVIDAQCTNIVPKERPGIEISLFKVALDLDVGKLLQLENLEEILAGMLTQLGSRNPRPDPMIIYPCVTADKPESDDGGRRWIIGCHDILLAVTCSFPANEEHVWGPIFERMLSSLRIDREKEALYHKLLFYVVRQLQQQLPNVKWVAEGIELRSDRMTLSLGSVFTRVQQHPDRLQQLADEFVQGISTVTADRQLGGESWESVKSNIVPLLKPDRYLQQVAEQVTSASELPSPASDLLATPWLADLHVCYAVDSGRTFRLLYGFDLQRWGIDVDELHSVAIDNLASAQTPELMFLPNPVAEGGVAMLQPKTAAASSYALHPKLHEIIAEKLGDDIMIAIPDRDALVVFVKQLEFRQSILAQVREDFSSSTNPLCDRLFRLTPDGVTFA